MNRSTREQCSWLGENRTLTILRRAGSAHGLFPLFHPGHVASEERFSELAGVRTQLEPVAPALEKNALTVQFEAGSAAAGRVAQVHRSQLSQFGILIRLRAVPFLILVEQMRKKDHAPLKPFAYRIRPDWDGRSLLHFEGRQDQAGFADRALDALLDRTAREMDVVRWRSHVREIGRRFRTHLSAIPLLFRQTVSVPAAQPRRMAAHGDHHAGHRDREGWVVGGRADGRGRTLIRGGVSLGLENRSRRTDRIERPAS